MAIKTHLQQSRALEHFEVRGDGSSRLEALSDGVFALAIAILLLSSSVPKNFQELWAFVVDIVPFGICMLFIYWIWRQQVTFFMR
ncbi:MAG: TMEM175 family protein [Cyclobacteriaceae bacterium]|nr:TMEM175 family protein [Cyclobacteriaceae bacterium]